jgi:uncharacterized protein YqjF (DUF2071 family)
MPEFPTAPSTLLDPPAKTGVESGSDRTYNSRPDMKLPTLEARLSLRERPQESPKLIQHCHDILWMHWSCPVETVQAALPPGLHVDTYKDKAFVGIVPQRVTGLRLGWAPPIPFMSSGIELSVRTYVHDDQGRPGIWFFSIDTNNSLAVTAGRSRFKLNYQPAITDFHRIGKKLTYMAIRKGEQQQEKIFFRIRDDIPAPAEDSLEFFLTERYLLFTSNRKRQQLFAAQFHHKPFAYAKPDVGDWQQAPFRWNGSTPFAKPPTNVLYSTGGKVEFFPLKQVS